MLSSVQMFDLVKFEDDENDDVECYEVGSYYAEVAAHVLYGIGEKEVQPRLCYFVTRKYWKQRDALLEVVGLYFIPAIVKFHS